MKMINGCEQGGEGTYRPVGQQPNHDVSGPRIRLHEAVIVRSEVPNGATVFAHPCNVSWKCQLASLVAVTYDAEIIA
jgi:hypothetical protein